MNSDLFVAQENIYEPSGFFISNLARESESQEYNALKFEMNNKHIQFRTAKITPTKVGQFVTLWKRIGKGPIQPYDLADPIDLFVVSVRSTEHFGQFVFPKSVLWEKDIVSKEAVGGKRAMRVYPPWDKTDNRQAQKTQAWQLLYFFEIDLSRPFDVAKIQQLFR